jgi:hypothetical protein
MTITRFSAVALASLLLLPAAAGAQQVEKAKGKGNNRAHKGDYSFRLTASGSACATAEGGGTTGVRQDVARVGTFSIENDGTISGHSIATSNDGTTTVVIDFTWSGTFTVNDDGTGSISITTVNVTDASCTPAQAAGACAGFEGPETYAFALNNHGDEKLVSLIETDNAIGAGKSFLTGDATRR